MYRANFSFVVGGKEMRVRGWQVGGVERPYFSISVCVRGIKAQIKMIKVRGHRSLKRDGLK